MPAQEIIWTVCPNGLTADGRRLRLSVFVAPRLYPDFGPTFLAAFPDFVDWPARLREIAFSLGVPEAAAERQVPLTIVSPPADSGMWGALLPPGTPVVYYEPDQHADRPVCTYSVPDVIEAIRTAYLDTATVATVEPPLNVTPPDLHIPTGPEPRLPPNVGLDDLFGDFAVDPVSPELPNLIGQARLTGQTRGQTRGQADSGPVAEEMLEVFPTARTRLDHIKRVVAFSATPVALDLTRQRPWPDFHQRLTALGEHSALLRRLGLVLDAEVDVAAVLPPEVTTLRVRATWRPLLPDKQLSLEDRTLVSPTTTNQSPVTAVDPRTGLAARRDGGTPGVLALPEDEYLLEELDVDGTVHKAVAMVAALSAHGDDRIGPPALRTAGLALVRVGHAQQVHASFLRVQSLPPEPLLYAEDLTRGYRVDVRDLGLDGRWRSLHRRSVTYEIEGLPDPLTIPEDEGVFATSMRVGSADPASEVYLHENLVVWNGWSLSAPRPGQALANPGPAPEPAPDERLRLTVRAEVLPGSLPRLRFGHSYQLRLRTVDLAGNGPAPDAAADAPSGQRAHLRFEPVGAPVFAPDAADVSPGGELSFGPGETVHRLVIRNYLDDAAEPVRRRVLAPRGSAHLAELHGRLDDAIGVTRRAEQRAGGLDVVSRDGAALTYPVGDVPPYLPDPLAQGVSFRGLPTMMTGVLDVPFDFASWHEPHTFGLVCTGPDAAGPRYDGSTRTLTVPVEPGDTAEIRASSLLTEPELMALLRWARETRSATEVAELEAAVRASAHCMFTPWQTLTLVHAVIRPLMTPDFVTPPSVSRGFNDSGVDLGVTVSVHARTTGTVSLVADWQAQVDDLTKPAWSWRDQHGTVFTHALPEDWQAHAPVDVRDGCWKLSLATGPGGTQPTHQLGDTRHRRISYRMVSTTRFAGYFDPEVAGRHGGFALDGEPVVCEILNSAPAPALAVLGSVPALLWDDSQVGTATIHLRHGGVRVYLQRPWFATGDGELLGVVLAGPAFGEIDDAGSDPRAHLVSRIGQDPVRGGGRVEMLSAARFRNAVTTLDVELAELRRLGDGGPTVATVAGFAPDYDEVSGRWFCDIDIDTGGAYLPFVRLVVARFQPASLRGVTLPGDPAAAPDLCVVSPIVALDPVTTLPDRRLTLTVNDDRTVDVHLAGVTYTSVRGRAGVLTDAAARSRVWARWASRPAGSSAAWTLTDGVTHEIERDDANGVWRMTGLPSPATTPGREYRLLVAEVERTPADLGTFEERVVFADAITLPVG